MDLYDKTTWPNLTDQRQQLRDKLFDMDQSCPVALAVVQGQLDAVEARLQAGETHEYPW